MPSPHLDAKVPTVNKTGNQHFKLSERIAKVFQGACVHKNICPIKDIMARFGDKWSIYAILLLGQNDKMRFNELKSGILGISQRMLTVTLRSLEEDGIIVRTHYPEIPPRVEYELSELGKSLMGQLLALANWADDHMDEILKSRRKYAKRSY